MPKSLSSRWLMLMMTVAGLLCGLKPGLLAHVVMVMGVLWVFMWRDEHGAFAKVDSITKVLMGLVLAWAAASLQWSLLPVRAMYDLVVLLVLGALMLHLPAGMAQLAPEDNDKILRVVIAAAAAAIFIFLTDVAIDLVWQRVLSGKGWGDHIANRALISRAAVCILFLLWAIVSYGWRRRWHLLVFFIWIITGVGLTMSDSASSRLAFAASTVIFLLASRWPRFVRVLMGVAVLSGCLLALPAAKVTQDLLEESGWAINNSFMHRTEIWRFTADRITEKPILGWGMDSARAISSMGEISVYQGFDPMKSMIPMHPHNWVLHAMLELGIVGLVLLAALWLWLLHLTSRLQRNVQALALAGYSIAMVSAAFSIGLWQGWWLCILLFFALVLQLMDHEARRTRQ